MTSPSQHRLVFLSAAFFTTLLLLAPFLLVPSPFASSSRTNRLSMPPLSASITNLTSHPPIYVQNDSDLLRQARAEGWPGSGTPDDPIIVSGYAINSYNSSSPKHAAIHLTQTSLHVRIERCYLYYEGPQPAEDVGSRGIYLCRCHNIVIADCIIANNYAGIETVVRNRNGIVENCYVINNSIALSLHSCYNWTIKHCYIVNLSLIHI